VVIKTFSFMIFLGSGIAMFWDLDIVFDLSASSLPSAGKEEEAEASDGR
jgi:hypothetical protein